MHHSNNFISNTAHKPLEELNLLDDFLFQQLVSQKDDGEEFCRILLSTILGKQIRKVRIIPQKNILGIDTQLLATNTTYDKLPNVVIIVILPYDPFDKNRMVYTVKNQCVEDPSIPYDDGAQKIFLYTKRTEGNPSQELKDMLQYIEKTVDDNVTNHNIDTIHQFVKKIKQRKEVGINYMKSWEIEQMCREEGKQEGLAQGIEALILTCQELNVPFDDTLRKVEQKFSLTYDDAQKYMQQYWKTE